LLSVFPVLLTFLTAHVRITASIFTCSRKIAAKPIVASITLSLENAESISKLAALIGWTPDKLANRLLAETLEEFADR
jgi:hypothetical protein